MADSNSYKELSNKTRGNTGGNNPVVNQKVRLSIGEFDKLEEQVKRALPPLTSSEAGSLGMHAGAHTVLTLLRKGFVAYV